MTKRNKNQKWNLRVDNHYSKRSKMILNFMGAFHLTKVGTFYFGTLDTCSHPQSYNPLKSQSIIHLQQQNVHNNCTYGQCQCTLKPPKMLPKGSDRSNQIIL